MSVVWPEDTKQPTLTPSHEKWQTVEPLLELGETRTRKVKVTLRTWGLFQKGYSSVMCAIMDEEAAEKQRKKAGLLYKQQFKWSKPNILTLIWNLKPISLLQQIHQMFRVVITSLILVKTKPQQSTRSNKSSISTNVALSSYFQCPVSCVHSWPLLSKLAPAHARGSSNKHVKQSSSLVLNQRIDFFLRLVQQKSRESCIDMLHQVS